VLPVGEPLEEEVTAAYREYWRVYSDALYTLDASQLPRVASGAELDRLTARIRELKEQGEAIRVNVDHVTNVLRVSGPGADVAVRDRYTDRSFALDASTKEPLPAREVAVDGDAAVARGTQQDRVYFLKRSDDTWKVVQAFQVSS
jgi:hypothetical protein